MIEIESKKWLVGELLEWRETFRDDDDDEDITESIAHRSGWDVLTDLIEKVKKNECTAKDYEEIIFHLWQISYGQDKI